MSNIAKRVVDIAMTVCLLLAFAYQLTGNLAHEIIGVTMFVLIIVHNMLNLRWYKTLFKGRYTVQRVIGTATNFLMLLLMVTIVTSGILISRDLFSFLPIDGGHFMRQLHTLMAYWGLILMSIHLGLHWQLVMFGFRKMFHIKAASIVRSIVLWAVALCMATCGVRSSFLLGVGAKLVMRDTFSYWGGTVPGFFFAYLSVLALYVAITHYALKLLEKSKSQKSKEA